MADARLSISAGPPGSTPIDVEWEARAQRLEIERLDSVRKAAAAWTGTVGALTGLLGIAAFSKSPTDLTTLQGDFLQIPALTWVVFCTALGATLAIAATVCAAIAAQGVSGDVWPTGDALREATRARARQASLLLRCSRYLAPLALIPVFVAIFITWSSSSTAASEYTVLLKDGRTVCGHIANGASAGLLIETSEGQRRLIPLDAVETISQRVCKQ